MKVVNEMVAKRAELDQEIMAARDFFGNEPIALAASTLIANLPADQFREAIGDAPERIVGVIARLSALMLCQLCFSELDTSGFFEREEQP